MKITPVEAPIFLPPPATPRSEGVHVSSIIRAIALDMGKLKPEYADPSDEGALVDQRAITDPLAILRMSIGLAWENWYIPQILGPTGVKKHPGELHIDNIHMSPDGLSVDVIITQQFRQRVMKVHEVKATYKSTNTVGDMSREWMWLAQLQGYCKGAGTRHAKIHVLFLCGDYKMPITPQLKCWDINFTQVELDQNWELMKEYRDYREGL